MTTAATRPAHCAWTCGLDDATCPGCRWEDARGYIDRTIDYAARRDAAIQSSRQRGLDCAADGMPIVAAVDMLQAESAQSGIPDQRIGYDCVQAGVEAGYADYAAMVDRVRQLWRDLTYVSRGRHAIASLLGTVQGADLGHAKPAPRAQVTHDEAWRLAQAIRQYPSLFDAAILDLVAPCVGQITYELTSREGAA